LNFPEQQSQPIQPQYGCLKNGSLPTYRQFYNRQTMKNHTGMGNAIRNTQSYNNNIDYNDNGNNNNENENGNENGNGNEHPDLSSNRILNK
jgi:hypothetical protein